MMIKNSDELYILVMNIFNTNLESEIKVLGKQVIKQIQKGYNIQVEKLAKNLRNISQIKEYLQILDQAISHALKEIKQLFVVTYNENEEHIFETYLGMIEKKSHISVINNCDKKLRIRNGIIWSIDIILKNCIENVEKHAKIPMEEAAVQILVEKIENNIIKLTFKNGLSPNIDRQDLSTKIYSINKNIKEKRYLDINTEDNEHGLGYYRIAHFLHNNLKEPWKLYLSLDSGMFLVNVCFKLEG